MVGKSFEKCVKAKRIGLEKALESGGRLEHIYTSRDKGAKRGALQAWGEEDVPRSTLQRRQEGMHSLGQFASFF